MTKYKCVECGTLWNEHELLYKRVRDYDPEEGWKYVPICPACGASAVEVNVCPICEAEIDWNKSFCDDCIDFGARQVRNFIEGPFYVRGNDIEDLDDLTREDYFNHILEKA